MNHSVEPAPSVRHFSEAWKRFFLIWAVAVLGLLGLFYSDLVAMVTKWSTDQTFGHCYLIMPIVIWLIWMRKDMLAQIEPKPFWPGLLILLAVGGVWVIGHLARVNFIEEFALIGMIQAATLTILGRNVTRALIFPLFFMFFNVPFGDQLVPIMQDFTARFCVHLLEMIGIPVFHDGIFISIPTGDFEVAQACSGVRFIIAMFAVGLLYANIAFKSLWRRAAIMALSIVVPIIANGFRAFGIIYIAYATDNEFAVGVDHIVYGWLFFSVVMILVLLLGRTFSDRWIDDPILDVNILGLGRAKAGTLGSGIGIALASLLLMGSVQLYAQWIDNRKPTQEYLALTAPTVPGWSAVEGQPVNWRPHYNGANAELLQTYESALGKVTLYVAAFNHQVGKEELIAYGQTAVAPANIWTVASKLPPETVIAGTSYPVLGVQINGGGAVRDVWQWYWVNGRLTSNPYEAKFLSLMSKLTAGPTEAATIVISAQRQDPAIRSTAMMSAFANAMGPIVPALHSILQSKAQKGPQ